MTVRRSKKGDQPGALGSHHEKPQQPSVTTQGRRDPQLCCPTMYYLVRWPQITTVGIPNQEAFPRGAYSYRESRAYKRSAYNVTHDITLLPCQKGEKLISRTTVRFFYSFKTFPNILHGILCIILGLTKILQYTDSKF